MFRQLMLVSLAISGALSLSSVAWAETVRFEQFQTGAKWVWAYSERSDRGWMEPYLYETYEVAARLGNQVTVFMSSGPDKEKVYEPHHYFVVDLNDCARVKNKLGMLNKLKLLFYTKSFSEEWERVSRRHKGLAFTEKFNCLGGWRNRDETTYKTENHQNLPIFKWNGFSIHSWYFAEGPDQGVAALRYTGKYKMELVKSPN